MIRWTRRRFLGATAATVCVGCAGDDDADDRGDTSTTSSVFTDGTRPDDVTVPVPFGLPVSVGRLDDVLDAAAVAPVYSPETRAWLVRVPADQVETAIAEYDESLHEGLRTGLMALYQKCPHLGCRVPFCESSGWFECACHGTRFSSTGEHRDGPSERGLDAFPVVVDDRGGVSIVPGEIVLGLPRGSNVIDAPAVGPSCVEVVVEH